MKKICVSLLFVSSVIFSCAQQKDIRLVVRGDDMGYTHSGNEAIIKCYKEGIESSIEVLVASPWFTEAVKLLKQNPGIDVGIHLDLTSEWENVKWRPLSDCPSLKDAGGYFYPMVFQNPNYPGRSISENKWKIEDVEKEFRAQIELALKYLPSASHFSAHMGCTNLSPDVKALTKRLAKEYKIPVDPDLEYVGAVGYDGPHKTPEEKIQSFINMLNKLQPGKTYIFVDHPGINDDELKAVYHIGYEDVCTDRQGVTDLYTNEKVKALIKEKGIKLIGYRDIAQ
jgi:chitin disaccharide deacetylase